MYTCMFVCWNICIYVSMSACFDARMCNFCMSVYVQICVYLFAPPCTKKEGGRELTRVTASKREGHNEQ